MSIKSYIPSSLTVGLLTFLLVFGLSVVVFGESNTQEVSATVGKIRTIEVPGDTSLSVERGSTNSTGDLQVTYETDYSGDQITVSVTSTPTSPVSGAKLKIQGGDLGTSWSELWSYSGGSSSTASQTIATGLNKASGNISDLKFQIDAEDVSVGATNLGKSMSFTITYTIEGNSS
ncbi:hypothetical protein KGY79_10175 [Candidatus Bipolaricaulota bacterium]|nr:hypothetical protein [Candidatus Bipolaricaulota bacterium]